MAAAAPQAVSAPPPTTAALLRKRARDHNSGDEDHQHVHDDNALPGGEEEAFSSSDDESGGAVTRFDQGCRSFRAAFLKIMAKTLPDDPLGPPLSARRTRLVAAKLAKAVEEHKPRGQARKEKGVAAKRCHVLPKHHLGLESREEELAKIAAQGVVRLFSVVSRGEHQKPRKDLN
ncbi:hypothetical protein PR202_gb10401 [Eleusine coracana subsp. coracana]|uniref:Uncharacterized protein n=1 Tax=Eleusine coracana subsp. coracana TaxID=191504 RepID=A0AAV5EJ74_ELECO|nr:hypothetical protein PR202_gb10401 [Eleusine coracana subsp. coracana]